MIAFIAGVGVTLLGVLLVRPLLESEPPAPVPAIDVRDGKDGRDDKKKDGRKDDGRDGGGASGDDGSAESAPSFAPGRPPDRGSKPPGKSPPAATRPPPVSDDDDDEDDGDDDSGTDD